MIHIPSLILDTLNNTGVEWSHTTWTHITVFWLEIWSQKNPKILATQLTRDRLDNFPKLKIKNDTCISSSFPRSTPNPIELHTTTTEWKNCLEIAVMLKFIAFYKDNIAHNNRKAVICRVEREFCLHLISCDITLKYHVSKPYLCVYSLKYKVYLKSNENFFFF